MMLVYTLWVLVTLLVIGTGTARDTHLSVVEERRALDMMTLRAAAISGVEASRAVLAKHTNSSFAHLMEPFRTEPELCMFTIDEETWVLCYHVVANDGAEAWELALGPSDEESRINLLESEPWLLARLPGVTKGMAQQLTAYMERNPTFRPMTLRDLVEIPGWQIADYEDLEPLLTFHGTGKVNVNTASSRIFELLGASRQAIDDMMSYLAGPNGARGDADDRFFSSVSDIIPELQESGASVTAVREWTHLVRTDLVGVASHHYRVRVRAVRGWSDEQFEVSAVLRIDDEISKVEWWEERPPKQGG
jgi:hypothetical protein